MLPTLTAAATALVFLALSLLHGYWAMGGTWAGSVVVPELAGKPTFRPGVAATLRVALLLLTAAAVVGATAHLWIVPPPRCGPYPRPLDSAAPWSPAWSKRATSHPCAPRSATGAACVREIARALRTLVSRRNAVDRSDAGEVRGEALNLDRHAEEFLGPGPSHAVTSRAVVPAAPPSSKGRACPGRGPRCTPGRRRGTSPWTFPARPLSQETA